ncbi:hypothetical protein [Pyrobaculum calidifontis]|uniref:PaREP10 n=1 Tax=Pyrobaculum calidifontis (strain DSM 21063 / JCM 11548 / VA1) TaxID=410359 RepID=A3MUC0_PYRCJ|nr:hypothetical protein [Pyrobaculum calidifontis]ABO08237.1 paREP10 [Pyrobaculum calidifontis JCM 11548]
MTTVRELLGVSAFSLLRYGIHPDDDIYRAIEILEREAPHVADLLKSVMGGWRLST